MALDFRLLLLATAVFAAPDSRLAFVKSLTNSTLPSGGALRLECRAHYSDGSSAKRIKFQWLWNEGVVSDKNRTSNRRTEAVSTSVYRVKSVDTLDKGFYACIAADSRAKIRSDAFIDVLPPPTPRPPPTSPLDTTFYPMETRSVSIPVLSTVPTRHPGICQIYTGKACELFLANMSVYIPHNTTQEALEFRLSSAFTVVSYSNEISSECMQYALPSICYSAFPICRTPDATNEAFFEHLSHTLPNTLSKVDRRTRDIPRRADFQSPFGRSSVSLRRVCRRDCEILEDELCRKEYVIAKNHPEIGQKLPLEQCVDLPEVSPDCLEIGIKAIVSDADDTCFWETGTHYRGDIGISASGRPCIRWSHQFKLKIATHRELSGGHNHCRNPGGVEPQPWCYVDNGTKIEAQPCDVPRCSRKIWMYIIVGISCSVILLVTCITCCFCRRRGSKDDAAAIGAINLPNADKNIYGDSRLNSPMELNDLFDGGGTGRSRGAERILRVPQYSLAQIDFVEELGEGAFGKVYKGRLTTESGAVIYVAVKALKENASPKTRLDFRREIELISELRHENIVCILGVVLREEPSCMLFEFMAEGDLHEFLVGRSPPGGAGLSPLQTLSVSHHIASGMEYLAAHHYVHRDLAARNCLVADNLVVKISDFGLSRDIYSSDYYRVQSKSLLPVRWMPPESILYGKFTTESDVWSYGIVLWEIYSYGLQPYYGYSNQEVIAMVRGRELLQCPADCPRAVYELMRECWHQTAAKRPNFTVISNRLSELKHSGVALYVDSTSDSSGAFSSQRPPTSFGDHRERIPLIGGHRSSSNGSLAGSIPRKLSIAGSVRSQASARLMVSSSDVTSSSENCEGGARTKKSSVGSLLDDRVNPATGERRDIVVKIPTMNQPHAF